MASPPATIPLRFQRQELQLRADLSEPGLTCLATAAGPLELVEMLAQLGLHRDAVAALALILPKRQAVWWACLAVRLLPNLADRPADQLAVDAAEAWVRSQGDGDAERAGAASQLCLLDAAPGYAALAAHWCGPSLAPRGQQPVPPAPYLPGVATRAAMILLTIDPAVQGRLTLADLLTIGLPILHGDLGRKAQAALAERLGSPR